MDKKVIISMTTIPCRQERLKANINSILEQSYIFDKLIINVDDNLSNEEYEFYNNFSEIDKRIVINKSDAKWRSCNKLLPTLKLYPDEVIITCDDDIYYPIDCFKELIDQYNKTPDCIIAHEVNPIIINNDFTYVDVFNGYDIKLKQKEYGKYLSNCCLFPPHVFDNTDLFDYEKMMECTNGTHDELWFWVNSMLNSIQCIGLNYVHSFGPEHLKEYTENEYALHHINSQNDVMRAYMDKINHLYGKQILEHIKNKKPVFNIDHNNIYSFFFALPYIKYIYWYGYNINCQTLTKDWLNMLNASIHSEYKPII